jgi:hypothetical protein
MTPQQVLMHALKNEPLLQLPVKKQLKIAKRTYAKKKKRGTFVILYSSVQEAFELRPYHKLVWRPFDHEMVRDFSVPPLQHLTTYPPERAYHVLVVVMKKDGSDFVRRELVFYAPGEEGRQASSVPESKLPEVDTLSQCQATGCKVTANLSRCGRCKKVAYCGAEHAKRDWRQHKLVCKAPVKPATTKPAT